LDRFQSCHDFILVEYNCTFCDLKRQADQAEKTIILHQDEIMAALKSIQGSTIFTTATKSKKMMSDLNFIIINPCWFVINSNYVDNTW
jgi:hypothetical protein